MEDWAKAENIVKNLTGGKYTPASGAKNIKGDVRVEGWMLEVKQTKNTSINLQYKWFQKLEKHALKNELALVIFFELRGYVYYYEGKTKEPSTWSTMLIKEDSLPEVINTNQGIWELAAISSLSKLKEHE